MAGNLKLDVRIGREALRPSTARPRRCLPMAGRSITIRWSSPPEPRRCARRLAGEAAHRALSVNQLDHYDRFRRELPEGARVLIMGSGLVGTEFANDLVTSGYKAVVVDMLPLPLAQLVPPAVGEKVRDALAAQGVEWHLASQGRCPRLQAYGARAIIATLDDGTNGGRGRCRALGRRPADPMSALAQQAGTGDRQGHQGGRVRSHQRSRHLSRSATVPNIAQVLPPMSRRSWRRLAASLRAPWGRRPKSASLRSRCR